ncbi:aspartate/glutamate racemase family protein [Anaerotruncus rubiinfantis]|jgi:allantoin racemase|uniref:aspartate/glutamate racemase family protein n=2 Tax=Oscillospiraceae TaxID=216572 RepID=UPI0034A2D958
MMKILVINPNIVLPMTRDIEATARTAAGPGVQVDAVSPRIGPSAIECYLEFNYASIGVVDTIARTEKEGGADAYITACFCDPGLEAGREITEKPVVGICEAAVTYARMLAPNFSIVTVLDATRRLNEFRMVSYHAEKLCKSIRPTHVGVLEFRENPQCGLDALFEQSRLAVEEDGARCILLGCAGFAAAAREFTEKLGVPVLDGVTLAVRLAESLVQTGHKNVATLSRAYLETKTMKGFDITF